MSKPRAAVSWSGGKDSCLALHRTRNEFEITTLLTMFTEDGARSRSHGLRPEVLEAQASAMNLGLLTGRATWQSYEEQFTKVLKSLREDAAEYVIFGDIFLDDHRQWVERVCEGVGMQALEPLWNEPTTDLVREFLELGGRARIVAVNSTRLDAHWLGTPLTLEAVETFGYLGVDPCGEYGEYHTVVEWAPAFATAIQLREAGRYECSGYTAVDFALVFGEPISERQGNDIGQKK